MAITIDNGLDAAETIRSDAAARYATVRDNAALNDDARRARMARTHLNAKTAMAILQNASNDNRDQRIHELRSQAFGINGMTSSAGERATLAISSRDAQDRAAALGTAREALALLRRATDSGDELLARAVVQRAFDTARDPIADSDWGEVIDAYTTTRPAAATQLSELATLERSTLNARSLFGYVLPSPPELNGLSETAIRALSDGPLSGT